jgi:hypothetical protein
MMMLNVNGESVCRLIELSRAFQAQESDAFQDDVSDPIDEYAAIQRLAAHEDDVSLAEFRTVIEDLEPDQQTEVVALLWLGRGDFQEAEWEDAKRLAWDEWTPNTADYLIGHPMLPEYLTAGLAVFGQQCDQ